MITQPPPIHPQSHPSHPQQNPPSLHHTQHNNNHSHPKQCNVKIHDLQLYVSSIFNGCSMPPLNQFLDLDMINLEDYSIGHSIAHHGDRNQACRVRLSNYKKQKFYEDQESKGAYIYYVYTGKVVLKKLSMISNKQQPINRSTEQIISASRISSGKLGKQQQAAIKDRGVQIKEGNFFMLVNIKKTKQTEQLYISSHEVGEHHRCLIGKIKINPSFNLNWYISESQKHQFLSPFFQTADYSISEHKLKGLSRFFKYESFRRGTVISTEGEENERLCFVKSGQCQFTKTMSYNQKNHNNIKILRVANGGPRAVTSAQFIYYQFLGCSKSIATATKAMSQLQNRNQKLNFKMHDKDINNFTVTVLSSYVQIYYISVSKFKQLCQKYVPQAPQQLRRNIQHNYITLLRTTKQKLNLEIIKFQRNQDKFNQQRTLVEAKLQSGYFQDQLNYDGALDDKGRDSPIRIRKSELIQTNLKEAGVQRSQTRKLEKKIQLLLQQNKAKVNYKKKIQIVLKQKLRPSRIVQSPMLSTPQLQKQGNESACPSPQPEQVQKIKKDLQNIFENKDDAYRSNNIQKQQQMLKTKQNMLKKRYSSVDNMLIVHADFYDKTKNKLFRMDLIQRGVIDSREAERDKKNWTGFQVQSFTNRVKKQCIDKINTANKIKEQFMTIRSECEKCHCYDDIEGLTNSGHKDIKMQAMKTGSAWRTSETRNENQQQPLQKLHSRTKLISEKASRRYEHNAHLQSKRKRFISGSQRRLSAPLK